MSTVPIRAEQPQDAAAVREVNLRAFPTSAEADLVDALRAQVQPWISLVALQDGQVAGHALYTPVHVQSAVPWAAMALGPMAVLPELQRRGIGSALIRAGLAGCRRIGHPVVFVLGHAEYYPRFGFAPAPPQGLTCDWPVPDDVFMVAELEPGALAGRTGRVKYHPAFDGV
jgi:putative acetyltransferase